MRSEPRFDAIRMEHVATIGQKVQDLVILELNQAHGALQLYLP